MNRNNISIREVRRSWWYGTIRSINYFTYRYWWLIWIIFILSFILYFSYCFSCFKCNVQHVGADVSGPKFGHLDSMVNNDCNCTDTIRATRDTIPKPPEKNCRVHFTGANMGGYQEEDVTMIYQLDQFSEFVGSGNYPSNAEAFPKAVASTFDGIAIDSGTHLVIYEKPNFEGRILLDVVGPALIYNVRWKNDSRYNKAILQDFPEPLQSNYPPSVRHYSKEDMHDWSKGSCKIRCD